MGKRNNMTQMKRFSVRGQSAAKKPYHYRACGLDDVYLTSGFAERPSEFGLSVLIDDVRGLHHAIGLSIINESKPLSPREFRFLRKNMDLTQEDLAARLRVDAQTIARYEKDQSAIPGATNMVLRMFAFHVMPSERQDEIAEEIKAIIEDQLSESAPADKAFDKTSRGWRERAMAAH